MANSKVKKHIIHTPHGDIQTPVFMPVGTCATVKSLSREDLESIGAQIILANNYHLYLRPGSKNIAALGGIHQFANWPHPILTDSGGFQVHSLNGQGCTLSAVSDEGVQFTSHLDGTKHFFTPESAIQSQIAIGADIIMALDVCTPNSASHAEAQLAMHRTHNWLVRCKKEWERTGVQTRRIARADTLATTWHASTHRRRVERQSKPLLFGIIQGGVYKDLRRQSAKFVVDLDLPGIAIGGQSIGSDPKQTAETISYIKDLLPPNKPLYTMGLGVRPSDLVAAVSAGADMFDCVAPTRLARCGLLYNLQAPNERISIAQSRYKLDQTPIDSTCDCSTCATYPRAYLHHLFKCQELLYYRLASIHNLRTMIRTVEKMK